jgi:hypothetical protein
LGWRIWMPAYIQKSFLGIGFSRSFVVSAALVSATGGLLLVRASI